MTTDTMRNVAAVRLLSPMQAGMLYHSLSDPGSGVFIQQMAFSIEQDLDSEAMRRVWSRLVERHEALRTAFFWDGLDDPVAVVRESAQTEWLIEDWSGVSDQEDSFQRLIRADRNRGFDLSEAPLFRMALVRVAPERWRWLWTFHHMILDGWSAQLLLDEVRLAYRAEIDGETVELAEPFDYSEYLSWLAGGTEDDELFWSEYLSGFTEPHRLEIPGLPSPKEGPFRTVGYEVDDRSIANLTRLAARSGVTLNTAVVAAWSLVLSRWVGSRDVVFGVTTAGRPVELEGVGQAVGLFINTIPLRLKPDPSATVVEWLKQVQNSELDARDFQHVPLSSIQKWSDVAAGDQLFESLFVFENYPPADAEADDALMIDSVEFIERSNYPFAVLAVPSSEGLTIKFVFDSSRFSQVAIDSLADQLQKVMERFGADPGAELRYVRLTDGSGRMSSRSEETVEKTTFLERFGSIVSDSPHSTAIVTPSGELTYGELDERASALDAHLRSSGVGLGALVGVITDRSLDSVVGILGVLKAGAAYVPLDPSYPAEHLERLIRDSGVTIVVAGTEDLPGFSSSIRVVRADDAPAKEVDVPDLPGPDDLAYVIHTSGSTGGPKGVMVSHANLAYSTNARSVWYGDPVGRFLLLSSFSFDSSVVGLFWTLATGGALIIPPSSALSDADALVELAERERVTHLLALPGLYEIMMERAGGGELDELRVAIIAGEPGTSLLVEAHRQRLPTTELHNEYGPTEATVWATAHKLGRQTESDPLPIGSAIPGTAVAILDEHRNPTPSGFTGELWVEGPGVAQGYLGESGDDGPFLRESSEADGHRSYRTGDLVAVRPDGEILFLGRSDTEVKVRGHRIDTSYVASELRRRVDVADVAVSVLRSGERGSARLVGYVASGGRQLDAEAIKAEMAASLPDFMVPSAIVEMDEIPRLPNGKIDLTGLPDALEVQSEYVAPRNDIERALADLWGGLLDLENVGVDDSWVSLGGDSLLGIRMISRARDLGIDLQPADLAANPTISRLALSIENPDPSTGSDQLIVIQPQGEKTPLICLHAAGGNVMPFQVISDVLGPTQPVYAFTAVGIDGRQSPLESIPEMARLYIDQLKGVQPDGPYRLLGDCMGGAIGLELAHQLERMGETVEALVIIDGALPLEGSKAGTPLEKAKQTLETDGIFAVARGLGRLLTRRLGRQIAGRFGGSEGEFKAHRDRVVEASVRAFGKFQPTAVSAPILLVKSTSQQAVSDGLYWHMSWDPFTPDLEVEFVQSDHETITREPAIRDVAALIGRHLEKVRQ